MVPMNHIFEYPVPSTACTKPLDMSYLGRTSGMIALRFADEKLPTQYFQGLVVDWLVMKSVVSGEIPRETPTTTEVLLG
jgi:hypothetical protein